MDIFYRIPPDVRRAAPELYFPPGDPRTTCAGWEECSPGYEITRDGFRYLAIGYIAGGNWELETHVGKWTMGPGTIFACGPEVADSLRALSDTGLAKYFVDLSGHSAARLLARTGLKGATPKRVLNRRWFHNILEQLIETASLSRIRRPALPPGF